MKKLASILSFSILLFGVGCSNDKKGKTLCRKVVDKMVACDVLSEGDVNCDVIIGEVDDLWKCELKCLLKADCDEVDDAVCDGVPIGDLRVCADACWDTLAFQCDDGVQQIYPEWECDCEEDCADGSDEDGCPVDYCFDCLDGLFDVHAEWECDCEEDCEDGSDEYECPTVNCFDCGDGSFVPADRVCNFWVDCADASDEEGCAEDLCP